ncbi:hypothetical protein GCM10020218_044250 [Dactylosporangium vinaceum]
MPRPFALESTASGRGTREERRRRLEATVKVRVPRAERVIATAEGNGPVNRSTRRCGWR